MKLLGSVEFVFGNLKFGETGTLLSVKWRLGKTTLKHLLVGGGFNPFEKY